eukprot:1157853-Pelagomonas_calceolata.AAC.1
MVNNNLHGTQASNSSLYGDAPQLPSSADCLPLGLLISMPVAVAWPGTPCPTRALCCRCLADPAYLKDKNGKGRKAAGSLHASIKEKKIPIGLIQCT